MSAVSKNSRIPGLFRLSVDGRARRVAENLGLEPDELTALARQGGLTVAQADHMIENCLGTFALPFGVATNFTVNGRDCLVPMVTEEPSVVAAASSAAKIARANGGFFATTSTRAMVGQIQIVDCADFERAKSDLDARSDELVAAANARMPRMVMRGGGVRSLTVRDLGGESTGFVRMLVVQLSVDTVDAMGANAINTLLEDLAPLVESISMGRVLLRILSNFADECLAHATMTVDPKTLGENPEAGERIRDDILCAYAFSALDPYRAVTHNKGVMNGIDAVAMSTLNDVRAIEAAAHAYAARNGRYGPMTTWKRDGDGRLVGTLELPMPVGIVGGAIDVHPLSRLSRVLLGAQSARELAEVLVSVGLAQNFSALRALSTDGIQKGHMALHSRKAKMPPVRGEKDEP